jgi:hypothetical protein
MLDNSLDAITVGGEASEDDATQTEEDPEMEDKHTSADDDNEDGDFMCFKRDNDDLWEWPVLKMDDAEDTHKNWPQENEKKLK